jgi:hypothetical protein
MACPGQTLAYWACLWAMKKISVVNTVSESYSQHLIFFWTCRKGPIRLVLHYTRQEWLARVKHSSLSIHASWGKWSGVNIHNTYFRTYKNEPNKPVIHFTRLVRDKHSSLLGLFVSYEEHKVLWIQSQDPIHNSSFSSELTWMGQLLPYSRQEWLARDKHSRLLGLFVSYEVN